MREEDKEGRAGKVEKTSQSSTVVFMQPAQIPVRRNDCTQQLLCTLERTDDCSEDVKVSLCQGEHYFCPGQAPRSRGEDKQRGWRAMHI